MINSAKSAGVEIKLQPGARSHLSQIVCLRSTGGEKGADKGIKRQQLLLGGKEELLLLKDAKATQKLHNHLQRSDFYL